MTNERQMPGDQYRIKYRYHSHEMKFKYFIEIWADAFRPAFSRSFKKKKEWCTFPPFYSVYCSSPVPSFDTKEEAQKLLNDLIAGDIIYPAPHPKDDE